MKMKDFIIDKYELGIKGNGRLSEEPLIQVHTKTL